MNNLICSIREVDKYNVIVSQLLKKPKETIYVDLNWDSKRTYGQYNSYTHEFKISKYLVNPDEQLNTILHELCHVYAPAYDHHGPNWKRNASIVGKYFNTEITRVSSKEQDPIVLESAVAKVTCLHCGKVSYLYKKTKAYKTQCHNYLCGVCHSKRLEFTKLK